jgi:hypothetical protein
MFHLVILHDKMRKCGEEDLACCTLDIPNGETAESNSGRIGVVCQTAGVAVDANETW